MSEIFHVPKTSDSLKALVETAYWGEAVWATVSSGGVLQDRVIYRCPGYGRGMNTAVAYNGTTWSPDAVNWGRSYGTTGLLATTLDRNTVIAFVTFKNMGKKERMLPPAAPATTPISRKRGTSLEVKDRDARRRSARLTRRHLWRPPQASSGAPRTSPGTG